MSSIEIMINLGKNVQNQKILSKNLKYNFQTGSYNFKISYEYIV